MRRNRALALFEDDLEMRRRPSAPDADATLRLQRISTLLIREGSNDALYEHVLDAAIDLMSADIGSMQLFDPERGELKLLAARGFDPESAAHWEWVRPDSPSSCGMALSAGCRVIVPDIETHEAFARPADLDALRRVGIRAGQSTPLMARSGRLLGMISTHWRRPHRPTEHELQPLDVLARQAADLIERNEADKALRESREQFRWLASIVESSDDAIIGTNLDAVTTSWNKGAERLFGYLAKEIIGGPVAILIPPERKHEEYAILSRIRRGDRLDHFETVRRRKDGTLIDISLTVSPVRGADGEVVGASGISRDITERKRTEARLAEREAQLALFVEHAPAGVAMFDDKMRCLAVSRRFLSDHELQDPAEVIGRSVYEIFQDLPPRWKEIHVRVLAGEELAQAEDFFPRQDGRMYWVRWSMKPWRNINGRIGGAMLFAEMVNEQVEAKRAVAESEARFRATFENAAVGIAHFDPDFGWLRVNEAACRILGYRAEELVTKSLEDINHPDDLRACLAQVERMRDREIDGFGMDKRYRRKDGTIVWIRLTNGCVRKSDGSIDYFVCMFEDISARKQAEEEVRKSEERFRSSVFHSPLPILLFDDREEILALSQSWLEQTGYSREELRCIEDWTTLAYDEHSGEALEHIRQIISTEPEGRSDERTIRTKDGHERLWSFVTSAMGTQSDGRRVFICVAQDVTERKAHEERIQLLMREVNHRAKNMLSLVQAVARQTAAREPEDFIVRFTERIQALAANQDMLVRNEWRGIDVEDLVRVQLAHLGDLMGSRIAVDGPKLCLKATAAQAIGLALHELATNAGKYGSLSVGSGSVDVCWCLDGDAFAMGWIERNGPPVSPPKRRGFGSTVVDLMAKRTVDGEVKLDYAPSGLVWRLTCPAVNALEPCCECRSIFAAGENRTEPRRAPDS
jgi:PAS domain S-box-containing protein